MAVTLRLGLVALLAGLTFCQQGAWFTDLTLWQQAVAVSPQSPRAAMNYAGALEASGDAVATVRWLGTAADLAGRHRDPENFERLVRLRVMALEAFGIPACQNPSLSRFC